MHWSFEPDPNLKGSYRRRIEDIDRALKALEINKLPDAAKFVAYFFGCEKLAHGIVGIKKGVPAEQAYGPSIKINLPRIRTALPTLGITFPLDDLQYIFADPNRDPPVPPPTAISARALRNGLVHDFGPTKVKELKNTHTSFFNPLMKRFLACHTEAVAHLVRIWP